MSWLNERTDADIRVFGLELALVRIGDSALAPTFDVVQPNDWAKATRQAATSGASQLNQVRMAFFEQVFELIKADYPATRTPRQKPENWIAFASGPFGYELAFTREGYRADVSLDLGDRRPTKAVFDALR